MLLYDSEKTLISLNNVISVSSASCEKDRNILLIHYVGGQGFGYRYPDAYSLATDKTAIEKWLGNREAQ